MYKYAFLLLIFVLSTASFTVSKGKLKERVEELLELSVSLSDNSKDEIARIQSYLEPSDNQEKTAIQLYQMWHRELKTFGIQDKKVRNITYLKGKKMAFVEISIVRQTTKKGLKGKIQKVKENFTMKATWILVNGQWTQRTKLFDPN